VARRALALAGLLLAAAGVLADDSLGTLFLTPAERARLDSLRRGEPVASAAAPGAPREHTRALTGYVQRSDGRTTVWIDGRAVSVPSSQAPKLEPRDVQDTVADAPRIERTDPR
jgi:hypothetical protein